MRHFSLKITTLLAFATGFAHAQDATNALWNNSGPKEIVGLWVYPLSGGCPDLRTKANPLVFATRTQGSKHDAADLWYCFELPERDSGQPKKCQSGTVRLEFDASVQQYKGEYSFIMSDGSKREGMFVAQYCPKDSK